MPLNPSSWLGSCVPNCQPDCPSIFSSTVLTAVLPSNPPATILTYNNNTITILNCKLICLDKFYVTLFPSESAYQPQAWWYLSLLRSFRSLSQLYWGIEVYSEAFLGIFCPPVMMKLEVLSIRHDWLNFRVDKINEFVKISMLTMSCTLMIVYQFLYCHHFLLFQWFV